MAERKLQSTNRRGAPRRVPVSGTRDIFTVDNKDPNFQYRVVKDKKGRVDRFVQGGWEVVLDSQIQVGDTNDRNISEGSPVKLDMGRGETGYLMRIPKEWHDEDQEAKETRLRAQESEMHSRATQEYYGKLDIQHKRGLPPE